MKITIVFEIFMTFNLLSGCSPVSGLQSASPNVTTSTTATKNPDAKEILEANPDADLFQWDGLIYEGNVDWVDQQKFTKDRQIGKITKSFNQKGKFMNGMATKLPIGTQIFSVNERGNILIAQYNGKLKNYLALVEG